MSNRSKKSSVPEAQSALNRFKFEVASELGVPLSEGCLLYTSPSPRDGATSRMPSSA